MSRFLRTTGINSPYFPVPSIIEAALSLRKADLSIREIAQSEASEHKRLRVFAELSKNTSGLHDDKKEKARDLLLNWCSGIRKDISGTRFCTFSRKQGDPNIHFMSGNGSQFVTVAPASLHSGEHAKRRGCD